MGRMGSAGGVVVVAAATWDGYRLGHDPFANAP